MGLAPLEGLPGATRSGSVDPGALLYVLAHGVSLDELNRLLEHESGLEALGGLDEPRGLAVFTYRVAQAVTAMAAALDGLDALVFTAGIGENRPDVRARVCNRLAFPRRGDRRSAERARQRGRRRRERGIGRARGRRPRARGVRRGEDGRSSRLRRNPQVEVVLAPLAWPPARATLG